MKEAQLTAEFWFGYLKIKVSLSVKKGNMVDEVNWKDND